MSLIIETTFSKLRSLEGGFDLTPLSDVSLQYETRLDQLSQTGSWSYDSIASTEVVMSSGAFTATLSGTGFSPVSNIAALENAINDGFATGAFDSLTFDYGSTEILSLDFSALGIVLSSGDTVLTLEGALPGSFDDIFELIDVFGELEDFDTLTEAELDAIASDLSAYDLDGLSFEHDGLELLALTLDDDGASLVAGGLELGLDGTLPNDLGDVLNLAREVVDQQVDVLDWHETNIRFLDENGVELPFSENDNGFFTYYSSYGDYAYFNTGPTERVIQIEISGTYGAMGEYLVEFQGLDGPVFEVTENPASITPQVLAGNSEIAGAIDGLSEVDLYEVTIAPYSNVYAYAPGVDQVIDLGLLTELALSGATLGLEDAPAPVFTLSEETETGIEDSLTREDAPAELRVGGLSFDFMELDLSEDGTSHGNFIDLDEGRALVFGFAGDDTIGGGSDAGYLDGGEGHDYLGGSFADDTLLGQNGDDGLWAVSGDDSVVGGNGDDYVNGGSGFDTLRGGNGDDEVIGGDGRDLAYLGNGNDMFRDNGQGGVNGRDTVYANAGNDTVEGGNGNDVYWGQNGHDLLKGRKGNDKLFGGNQNDTMLGGDGFDTVAGGNGRDRAFMGNGNDKWFDNAQDQFGDDFVVGGQGDDTIQMWGGDDTATGASGADEFHFIGTDFGSDVITDFELGIDRIGIDGGLMNLTQADLDAISDTSSGDLVLTFNADSVLTLQGLTSNAGLLNDLFEL